MASNGARSAVFQLVLLVSQVAPVELPVQVMVAPWAVPAVNRSATKAPFLTILLKEARFPFDVGR